MQRDALTHYIDEILDSPYYSDLCPNGLQVEGRPDIKKIVSGVSASVELFQEAFRRNADAVLVHHGIIWNFERPLYQGGYKKRVKMLLENDMNLLAYHLPLDGNMHYGNNICIARLLELGDVEAFGEIKGQNIGVKGQIRGAEAPAFIRKIKEKINRDALVFDFGPRVINSVGIISGGAQKEIKQAVMQGLDLFITGEVSEHVYHYAKEEGIHFVAAGHHATEVFGVQALGSHLKEKFGLDVEYVDIPNPV